MSKGKHSASHRHGVLKFFLFLLLMLVITGGVLGFLAKQEIEGKGQTDELIQVTIQQGSGVISIANTLQEKGVIRFGQLFRYYVKQKGADSTLQYGEFTLCKGSSYDAIIEALSAYAHAESVRLTFPEGSTALAIATKIEGAGLCSAADFLEEANHGDFSEFHFWQYVPEEVEGRFMKCEGYLFPETYDFAVEGTVHDIVATFYRHFDSLITDEVLAELDRQGMTLNEIVTLASFVQEEAGNDQDDNVAQVFRNRLALKSSSLAMLQSNVSSYIKNDNDNNYLWNWVAPYYGGWDNIPKEIIDNYDTYHHKGLTPGAVSNPGLKALVAALMPQPSEEAREAYYFVTDKTGKYYYAKTYTQHLKNCDEARRVNKTA